MRDPEKIRAYDRLRGLTPKRKALVKAIYQSAMADPERKARILATKAKWRENNRIKRECHVIVGNGIRDSRIFPQPCERCGATEAQAHHEDYKKPYEIMWLCSVHHGERHREINEGKRK